MKRSLTIFILALLLILPAAAGAAAQAKYYFSWEEGGSGGGTALLKNGVTFVPLTHVVDDLSWDSSGKRAQFDGWNKSFAVRVGSLTVMLDGEIVKLEGAPFLFEKMLYVPARFVVYALGGGNLTWDARTKTVKADHLKTFKKYDFVHEGLKYTVEGKSGIVNVTDSKGVQREFARLGTSIKESLSFTAERTPGGLTVFRWADFYGEPHLNNQFFTLVVKDGKVIQQASVHYWNRLETNVTKLGSQLLLIDGKTLRIIEDGTGTLLETIDLVKLGGEADKYFVEYFAEDVFLLRANSNGILNLVDRDTGSVTILYKELLDAKHQEYVAYNDTPYRGDMLKFIKREGDLLYFKNEFPYDKDNNTYSISVAD
ncbi:copper amine oxidase N-terminal domain-containing protein [Paenibacillus sp. LHD-38]|uniref:copper amine oxidase N-terminal domain-containing protein n=1 Tax=Paenibacillus sp. LHD-38 TaxID=3072143 RepID=UPI00280E4E01|nr:copper amine oxidase N-terminal domain-containing protein [Paenibacillus sp. LHD-38]MDQ8733853.1 copper amine oxidase N-terminal domain-containing protein [Paenibacillus sp. LHD-38]